MAIDKKFIDQFVNVTSKAAISCYNFIGKNQQKMLIKQQQTL